jgi:pimeloyl-ACP methyl ester carboxylesterase
LSNLILFNAQTNTPMENAMISGYAPVNGLKMYYEIHGAGAMPLVLIHGGGSTIETTFGRILPALAANFKVIAVELQAHGRTSDRNAPESFQQDADDVAALLKYLNIGTADFFGFSNGGSTAMQIAIRHPIMVNKMIIASGAYKRDGFVRGFFDGINHATLADMPAILQEAYLKVNPDKNGLQAMFEKDVARMATFTDWADDDLRAIKAPALFMASDQDVVTAEHTIQMSRLVPGAKLVILPGGHGAFLGSSESGLPKDSQMPAITAALAGDFLNE